jgi:hypothetical protein
MWYVMGERSGAYRVLVGKSNGERLLGRKRRRWEENSKMNIQKYDERAWTGLI